MAEVVIVGGGVVGMGLGMMLARDGHAVTGLERDAQPLPDTAQQAWDDWDRTGVNQFRLAHMFLSAVPGDRSRLSCQRWSPPWRATARCASTR